MKAIIAVNNMGVIGNKNKLPWYCKKDLEFFKNKTLGCSCLVGYNTFQTLPILKNRVIIVDRKKEYIEAEWCIGGRKTYEKYAHLFKELHISHINDNSFGDTSFPSFKNLNPECRVYNHYF